MAVTTSLVDSGDQLCDACEGVAWLLERLADSTPEASWPLMAVARGLVDAAEEHRAELRQACEMLAGE